MKSWLFLFANIICTAAARILGREGDEVDVVDPSVTVVLGDKVNAAIPADEGGVRAGTTGRCVGGIVGTFVSSALI